MSALLYCSTDSHLDACAHEDHMLQLPKNLANLALNEAAGPWLAKLPDLVADLAEKWSLKLGDAYASCNVSYTAPATYDGDHAVLKIQWPHEECRYEADALRVWNGDGAVRLLDHDAERHALLLERCSPGTHLTNADDVDRIGVMIDLLPRLWKPVAGPFRTLQDEANGWLSRLHTNWQAAGKPCERSLIDAAAGCIADLSGHQNEQVLLHQDLHGDNVLAAERAPWLAIDPKPLVGEREFALAPIVRSFEFGCSRQALLYRLDRLSAELQLDRERVRGWTIAQSIAWSFGSGFASHHYQSVRWLLAAG